MPCASVYVIQHIPALGLRPGQNAVLDDDKEALKLQEQGKLLMLGTASWQELAAAEEKARGYVTRMMRAGGPPPLPKAPEVAAVAPEPVSCEDESAPDPDPDPVKPEKPRTPMKPRSQGRSTRTYRRRDMTPEK